MGAHASCCAAPPGGAKPPGWARGFTTDEANGEEAPKVDDSETVAQHKVLQDELADASTAVEEPSDAVTKEYKSAESAAEGPAVAETPAAAEAPTAAEAPMAEESAVQAPLYERLGGEAAVDAAVDQFYGKLLADEALAPMFASSDMAGLKGMQKKFLTLAFGGPADYSGKSMKEAHQGKGITNDQFGAVAGHLSATLTGLGVPGPVHDEVMAIAASTQGDIVEKSVFERIGGEAAVEAAVELFYAKILADATLAPMFASSDVDNIKAMQKKFLTVSFGGPSEYTGKSIKDAHKGRGITVEHFGAVAAHLSTTLTELGVGDVELNDVMTIARRVPLFDIVDQQKPKLAAKGAAKAKSKGTTKAKASETPKAKTADAAKTAEAAKKPDAGKEQSAEKAAEDPKAALKRRAEEWKKMSKADQDEKGNKLRAAARTNIAELEKLLEACVSPEADDKDGWTAMHIAANDGSKEMVKKLLDYGANPLAVIKLGEWGNTPLHYAARGGHKAVCKLLVKNGKKALTMKNNDKKTPAEMATGDLAEWFEDL